jgi:hypothetical protein
LKQQPSLRFISKAKDASPVVGSGKETFIWRIRAFCGSPRRGVSLKKTGFCGILHSYFLQVKPSKDILFEDQAPPRMNEEGRKPVKSPGKDKR